MVSNFASLMSYICILEFGTLAFNQSYMKDDASKDYISDELSIYFLIAQVSCLIPALGFGYLMDVLKVWKMILMFHVLNIVCIALFAAYTPDEKHIYNEDNP